MHRFFDTMNMSKTISKEILKSGRFWNFSSFAVEPGTPGPDKRLEQFLKLLDEKEIKDMLLMDEHYMLADNILIAMVFIYFLRSHLALIDFTSYNFFIALDLAHDIEEESFLSDEIKDIALGENRDSRAAYKEFQLAKYKLLERMGHRGCVKLFECLKVLHMRPHPVWKRWRSMRGNPFADHLHE